MALSQIKFNKQNRGNGGTIPSDDSISGLLIYTDAAPAVTGTTQFFSKEEALTAGITAGSVEYYHIKEYFRANPAGSLYVNLVQEPATAADFEEAYDLVRYSEGQVKQVGVFTSAAFSDSLISTLQGVATTLEAEEMNTSFVLAANFVGTSLSTLADITLSLAPNVSVCIAQDGANEGAALYASKGYTISALGHLIGTISAGKVSESVAAVEKFNASGAGELDVLAFANGTPYKSVKRTLLNQLDNKGYIFLIKYSGLNGSFYNASYTANASTSDFSTIEAVRTIDKAVRGVRKVLYPKLNSNVLIDPATGQLALSTVRTFEAIASRPLEQMVVDLELSGYDVRINPSQNVNITKELVIEIDLVRVGIAKSFSVNIGFSLTATQ
jgi:hypothetical protein